MQILTVVYTIYALYFKPVNYRKFQFRLNGTMLLRNSFLLVGGVGEKSEKLNSIKKVVIVN